MKVQGRFKTEAHSISGVVMDVAAFKVSHCIGFDIDATPLRAARVRSSSIGAMEEMSGKVQTASTHTLQCQSREHAHSSRSVQGPQFNGAMDESSGKGSKMQAHISSGVVMDIAAFKVSHPTWPL